MALRDTDTFLEWDVRETLNALELGPVDAAAAKLALQLARTLDAFYASENYSGAGITGMAAMATVLLRTLEALGATPAARAAIARQAQNGGENAPKAVSWLDQQRSALAATAARRN